MSLHKLTAGDGYTYLTRQVAAMDATTRGAPGLDAYYSEKGESPGHWAGTGLAALEGIESGQEVTEAHMRALFGEGRHPDADAIERSMIAAGATPEKALEASMLGRRFPEFDGRSAFNTAVRERFEAYNEALGLRRDYPVPAEDRANIRTEVAREMFASAFGRPPADPRELAGFIARSGRPATTAVAGYDLTFSPVKSVSTLWAVAPRDVAMQIEAAHQVAVQDTIRWIEEQASYTRTGHAGVRQVDVRGLLATVFMHRDARSGDPDLHTHVAVSNKVQTTDGKWLALDGRVLHKATVSASERYNTRLEAEVSKRLGVDFAERPGTDARKRPVREIVGVDARLNARWSSRRAAIDTRRAQLTAQFQARQGRPPTAVESIKLAQQATLETRQAKHEPRSLAEQRAAWRSDALDVLGSADALDRMVERACDPTSAERSQAGPEWVAEQAEAVLGTVQSARATWQVWHVRAEAERVVRGANLAPEDVDRAVEEIVALVLSPEVSIPLGVLDPVVEPAALRRRDGSSVYSVAGSRLLTSAAIMGAERDLVTHAGRSGGRAVDEETVELALLESAANGVALNPAQAQMVRDLATSTSRLQLAIAPAGSGKTTAMRVLSRAWADAGGTVVGLAPTAAAATVLGEEIGSTTDTLAKLLWSIDNDEHTPQWVQDVGPDTLVVVDEAGMAGTLDLVRVADYVIERGGSIRLIGDDQQLASIAAGGVLRDISESAGASTLSELVRFSDPAEGTATLGLRAGDSEALAFYIDNDRVHVGDESTTADEAYRAWSADRTAGHDAVMLAPTRDLVSALNARARQDRVTALAAAGGVLEGPTRLLGDGNEGSAGDVIVTRRNERRLPITSTDWVKNGDRWSIEAVQDNGDLRVRHLRLGRTITLPAAYVGEHVELGYASTVHGAQGLTADRCHVVATGAESRQSFYVAMTRGRHANHVYLSVVGDGDPHDIIRPETICPPTPTEILTGVLDRDQAQRSATTTAADLASPRTQLGPATDRYRDALGFAAQDVLGADELAAIDATAEDAHPGMTTAPAYDTLRSHLAIIALSGSDPHARLRAAIDMRELGTALDPAAVLDWRLDPTGERSSGAGPLPWLPGVPARLREDQTWGGYLSARADRVRDLAEQVRADADPLTPDTCPTWAADLTGSEHRQVRGDLAVWRSAMAVADSDRRPTGRPQPSIAIRKYQNALAARVATAAGDTEQAASIWAPIAQAINPRLVQDPYWPDVAARLASLARTGIDATAMLAAAAAAKDLPDELPAAAVWSRMAAHLTPAALDAGAGSGAQRVRPPWADVLVAGLGRARADRVMIDAAWPALVAAVTRAVQHQWTPEQILHAAADRAHVDLDPSQGGVRDGDLARALARHVTLLCDPAPMTGDQAAVPGSAPDADDEYRAPDLFEPPADGEYLPPDPERDDIPDDVDVLPPADPDDPAQAYTLPAPADGVAGAAPQAPPPADLAFDVDDAVESLFPSLPAERARLDGAAGDRAVVEHLFPYTPDPTSPTGRESGERTPDVPVERIHALNAAAAAFYQAKAGASWVPGYLADRLGPASTHPAFTAGYAPAGWTTLTDHLRTAGATDPELLAAGLARRTRNGRIIDAFRDRLVIALRQDGHIIGFTARANPDADDQYAGPKYLNTATTAAYDKSQHLFGRDEAAVARAAGARPVLVEGPLDAWAITAAGRDRHYGVAPLGTALTDAQADQLTGHRRGQDDLPPGLATAGAAPTPIVATDPDAAGVKAAARAFWALATRRTHPDHLDLPPGLDPAAYLAEHGLDALTQALEGAAPLADDILARFDVAPGASPAVVVWALRQAARIVATLPPEQWDTYITDIAAGLDLDQATVTSEVADAADAWTNHLRSHSTFTRTNLTAPPAAVALAELVHAHATPEPNQPAEPQPPTGGGEQAAPVRRRRSLASRLDDEDPRPGRRRGGSRLEDPPRPRRPDPDRPSGGRGIGI